MQIDNGRLMAAIAADLKARSTDPRYRAKQWLRAIVPNGILYLVVLPLFVGDRHVYDPSTPQLWIWLLALVLSTSSSIAFADRSYRNALENKPLVNHSFHKDLATYTGRGWILRTTRIGIYLGFGIGIPIGILMALFLPPDFGSGPERWIRAGMFVVVTMAWTIPIAFGIRWASLRMARRYIVP